MLFGRDEIVGKDEPSAEATDEPLRYAAGEIHVLSLVSLPSDASLCKVYQSTKQSRTPPESHLSCWQARQVSKAS